MELMLVSESATLYLYREPVYGNVFYLLYRAMKMSDSPAG
jgi:hypothetical protein